MFPRLRRLWRIPLWEAVLVSLPALAFAGWVYAQAWHDFSTLRALVSSRSRERIPWSVEVQRTFLHDAWYSLWHRALLRPDPGRGTVPTVSIEAEPRDLEAMTRQNLDLAFHLRSGETLSETGDWAKARVRIEGEEWAPGKIRIRGDNPFHWLYPQKSLRIKLKAGCAIAGARTFNLVNPRFASLAGEPVLHDFAREQGVLVPRLHPVRVRVNGMPMGIYYFLDQVDEGFLRRARLMPGSLYYGDGAPRGPDGVSRLFKDPGFWVKKASRNADHEKDRSDIEAMIAALGDPDPAAFRRFAEEALDVDRFLAFAALDNVFASEHHDMHHNHKIYFDPYRGVAEPIWWDPGLPQTIGQMDGILDPIRARLLAYPDWVIARDRLLYGMVRRLRASAGGLDERFRDARGRLEAEVAHDPFLDAGLVGAPPGIQFPHFSRPLPAGLAAFADETVRMGLAYHLRELERMLAAPSVSGGWARDGGAIRVAVDVSGRGGVVLERLTGAGTADGTGISVERESNGPIPARRSAEGSGVEVSETLLPGIVRVPRLAANSDQRVLFGTDRYVSGPLRYRYRIRGLSPGPDGVVRAQFRNVLTDTVFSVAFPQGIGPERREGTPWSVHPWALPVRTPSLRRFGPGIVRFASGERVVLGPETSVEIAPGTEFRMGKEAGIVMRGPLRAVGTKEAPIRFRRDSSDPWGGVALQGPATRGSEIAFWEVEGGTRPSLGTIDYTGMVDVHDTSDIVIRDSFFGRNEVTDDSLHLGYVRNFRLQRLTVRGARSDGVDVDISEGVVEDSLFAETGNDGLDLMTSDVRVLRSEFVGCGDKGISVGEETDARVEECGFARCAIGVQGKDQSRLRWGRNLIRDCPVGVDLFRKNLQYGGGGILEEGDVLFALRCGTPFRVDEWSRGEFAGGIRKDAEPGLAEISRRLDEAEGAR